MDLIEVMRSLNEKGIASAVQWFFMDSFEMYVGDRPNGIKAREWFFFSDDDLEDALKEAAAWLNAQARRHYGDWVHVPRRGSRESRLIQAMHRLHESEINSGLQWSPTDVTVWLGDNWNGIRAERRFQLDELDRAAQWLDAQARQLIPESVYAGGRGSAFWPPNIGHLN